MSEDAPWSVPCPECGEESPQSEKRPSCELCMGAGILVSPLARIKPVEAGYIEAVAALLTLTSLLASTGESLSGINLEALREESRNMALRAVEAGLGPDAARECEAALQILALSATQEGDFSQVTDLLGKIFGPKH